MYQLEKQEVILKKMYDELRSAGIPITGIYLPTSMTDAGLEIDNKYILHIAPYQEPGIFLDEVQSIGESIASFSSAKLVIQYIMEET